MNTIFSLGRYFYHFFIGELIKFRWGGSKFRWGFGSLKYRWGVGKIRWGPVSLGVLQRGVFATVRYLKECLKRKIDKSRFKTKIKLGKL